VLFHRLDFSAWFDEAFSYGMGTQPWGVIFGHWIWGTDANMASYYVILRGWLGLLGLFGVAPNELLLRLPSASFGIASVIAVYWLGRYLFGRLAGLVASGLFLTNFLSIIVAQSARAYTLGLFLLTLSWLAMFKLIDHPKRRWLLIYIISSTLAVYALLLALLVLASQAAAVGAMALLPGPWRSKTRSAFKRLGIAGLVTGLAIVPIGIDAAVHGGPNFWVPPVTWSEFRFFVYELTGQSRAYEYLVLSLVGIALLIAGSARVPKIRSLFRQRDADLAPAAGMTAWLVIPVLAAIATTQPHLNLHVFYPRYLVIVVPALALLAGLGVQSMPSRIMQLALVVALIAVAIAPLDVYYENAQSQDFKDPVNWIDQRFQPGDGIICYPDIQCGIPLTYSLAAAGEAGRFDSGSPGWFFWDRNTSVPVVADTVLPFAKSHGHVFFVYGPLGPDPAQDAEATAMEDTLKANGYRVVAEFAAKGSTSTTTVVLFERP
jgi:mannosyltransferase